MYDPLTQTNLEDLKGRTTLLPDITDTDEPQCGPQWSELKIVSYLDREAWWEHGRSGRPIKGTPVTPKAKDLFFSEREVEASLAEPLLREIGYRDNDWNYQVRVRNVDGGGLIAPDYVIGWEPEKGRARMVLEVKRKIKSMPALVDAVGQLKMYATTLRPQVSVLIASSGVWVFDARMEIYRYTRWSKLHEMSVFEGIKIAIGPRALGVIRHRCRLSPK